MKIIYLTLLAGVALVAPLRAQTNISDVENMSPQEFSQMLDRNLGKAKTDPAPNPTPTPVQSVSATSAPVSHKNESGSIIGAMEVLALISLALFFYFFPSIVGSGKRNAGAILVLNLFTGWSFIGWVIALVWACTTDPQTRDAQAPRLKEKLLRAHA